jgi:uncharacterized protein YlxW (UPF0749 family)
MGISEDAVRRRTCVLDEVDSCTVDLHELNERISMYRSLIASYKERNARMKAYADRPLEQLEPVSGNKLRSLYLRYRRHAKQ